MAPEAIFKFCNTFALLGWILLVFLGRRRWVTTFVTGAIIPLSLAVVYVSLLIAHWGESTGSFNTLAGVASLFANPWILLAGWIHYLAFDLFIGTWQVKDAARNGISHWFVIPCLIMTFLFGPTGLLLYFGLRTVAHRRAPLAQFAPAD